MENKEIVLSEEENVSGEITPYTESNQLLSIESLKDLDAYRKELAKKILTKGKYEDGVDRGIIPGTNNEMAFKGMINTVARAFQISDGKPTLDRDFPESVLKDGSIVKHFTIYASVPIFSLITGKIVAWGTGVCSSMEAKYRFRGDERHCPKCGQTTIIKGKDQYGGGWVCYKKKGGCGAKFQDGNQEIESQPVGKSENLNPHDVLHTVTSMAIKRARGRGVLDYTGMFRYLSLPYDIDDDGDQIHGEEGFQSKVKKDKTKKMQGDPPKKDKELAKKIDDFETRAIAAFGSEEEALAWFKNVSKNPKAKQEKYREGLGSFQEIISETQLNFLKSKFKKELAKRIPEQDINEEY